MRLPSIFLLLVSSFPVLTQTAPTLTHDAQVAALTSRIIRANGDTALAQGTASSGHIKFARDGQAYPIRITTSGNSRSRYEVDGPTGTTIRILNGGKATFQDAKGNVRSLSQSNTTAERISLFPALSLLPEVASDQVQSEWLGQSVQDGMKVFRFALALSDAADPTESQQLLKLTRTVFTVDASTYQVLSIQYEQNPERGSGRFAYNIHFSNFKMLGGVPVATTVLTEVNGHFFSQIDLDSFEIQSAPLATFALPAVSK